MNEKKKESHYLDVNVQRPGLQPRNPLNAMAMQLKKEGSSVGSSS